MRGYCITVSTGLHCVCSVGFVRLHKEIIYDFFTCRMLIPCQEKHDFSGAQLMLGLETTFVGSAIPVCSQCTQVHSAWPSLQGSVQCTGDGFGHCWGRSGEFCVVC